MTELGNSDITTIPATRSEQAQAHEAVALWPKRIRL